MDGSTYEVESETEGVPFEVDQVFEVLALEHRDFVRLGALAQKIRFIVLHGSELVACVWASALSEMSANSRKKVQVVCDLVYFLLRVAFFIH